MIGEVVAGRYRLVELVGEGATGAVYRAEDQEGKGAVAVKVLRQKSGPEAERRLEREAVAAGKLDHPNLVAVRDFGALDDGRPYLVMDLIEGRSLSRLMADGNLPADRALRILAHVLRGLDHAHAGGVVHRDLRPDDILLVDRDDATPTSRSSSISAPRRCSDPPAPPPSSSPAPAPARARPTTSPPSDSTRTPAHPTAARTSTPPPASSSRC